VRPLVACGFVMGASGYAANCVRSFTAAQWFALVRPRLNFGTTGSLVPAFQPKSGHPLELAQVPRHQDRVQPAGLRNDQSVQWPDSLAPRFEVMPDGSGTTCGGTSSNPGHNPAKEINACLLVSKSPSMGSTMAENFLDHVGLAPLDERNDLHLGTTLGTAKRIRFVNLLDERRPPFAGVPSRRRAGGDRVPSRRRLDGLPVGSVASALVGIPPVVPNQMLSGVRDMLGHPRDCSGCRGR
jgi:hypothetical protein